MKNLIYYFFFNLKYVIRIFFLLIKFLNLINSFDFMQLRTETSVNEINDNEKSKNVNNIMLLTFPKTIVIYMWLSLKICENFSENLEVNNILNIIVIIEIIDKSITDAINEEESLQNDLDNKEEIIQESNKELEEKKENIDK